MSVTTNKRNIDSTVDSTVDWQSVNYLAQSEPDAEPPQFIRTPMKLWLDN